MCSGNYKVTDIMSISFIIRQEKFLSFDKIRHKLGIKKKSGTVACLAGTNGQRMSVGKCAVDGCINE